jgi:hypothetical protein
MTSTQPLPQLKEESLYTEEGENHSYLFCKKTRSITPLIERKQGILEVPVHLYINKADKGLLVAEKQSPALNLTEKTEFSTNKNNCATNSKLSMASILKFWHGMDKG